MSFERALSDALDESYDLKLSEMDVRLRQNEVRRSKVDYFPKVRAQANLEYLQDLSRDLQPVAVVGNTIIPNTTKWQTALSVGATYNIFDFGVRGQILDAARKNKQAATYAVLQQRRDLKLKLIDAYTEVLVYYQALKAKEKILNLQHELFQMKKRLYLAGKIMRTQAADQAFEVAKSLDQIGSLRHSLAESLKTISLYTHRDYQIDKLEIVPFVNERASLEPIFAVECMPEYRMYDLAIEAKKRELSAVRRQRLPQFGLYSNFYMYGFDQRSALKAIQDFRGQTISFGISACLPVFDGFSNAAEVERKKLEIARMEIERNRAIWQLKEQHARLAASVALYASDMQTKEGVIAQGVEKVVMAKRLSDQEMVEKTEYLSQQVRLLEDELELSNTQVRRIASLKKLQALVEG